MVGSSFQLVNLIDRNTLIARWNRNVSNLIAVRISILRARCTCMAPDNDLSFNYFITDCINTSPIDDLRLQRARCSFSLSEAWSSRQPVCSSKEPGDASRADLRPIWWRWIKFSSCSSSRCGAGREKIRP